MEERPLRAANRAVGGVLAVNLTLFILITSLPAAQTAHHHWIFSVLAVIFGLQYLFLRCVGRERWAQAPRAEGTILSLLAFLLLAGVVRHFTILSCFAHCAGKLSGAALIAAWAFLLHGSQRRPGFWDPLRCRLAAAGGFLWGLYLALLGFNITPWVLDALFFIFALLLWLGRSRGLFFIVSLGILAAGAARATGNELVIIFFNLAWVSALLFGGAHRIEEWIERKVPPRPPSAAKNDPPARRLLSSAVRITLAVAVAAGIGVYSAGSIFFAANPGERRKKLLADAPHISVQDPAQLSPLARRLRGHVVTLAETIGERAAHQPRRQRRARDYVVRRLREMGYQPRTLRYTSKWMGSFKNGTPFDNVLAVLPGEGGEVFVVGAHYDTTTGTPGADDNASGVAVMLETARLLKSKKLPFGVHFVAFGTEEPPAFGTRNMGSSHYARRLRKAEAKVRGMISLEMLGYYNPQRGSQLYPPFMHLFYPSHGDYLSVVGNWRSRGLLRWFLKGWRGATDFPVHGALLPGVLSNLALSDQLNFWTEGYPALMLSDTAFYRNPYYHQSTDKPDTLDYEKMAVVTRALAAALEH